MSRFILILSLSLLLAQSLTGQIMGGISGKISDEGGYLPGAKVRVLNTEIGATTDETGYFEIGKLAVGDYTLQVTFPGYDTLNQTFEISKSLLYTLGTLRLSERSVEINTVLITGTIKEGEARALKLTKLSNKIVNIISADGVGKLPDRNAAEAVQRVPAVSIERDQGEGRYVSVRGTPADWSASLINGNRLPVADEAANSRTLAFDIFPSDLIQYIVLAKALTPDMEGDAIGGSIDFITMAAPAERTLNVSLGTGYNDQARGQIFSGSLMWGDRSKDRRFGYLVSGAIWNRRWATDNYEVVYGSNFNHGLNRLELRDYVGTRETIGLNTALEYRFSDFSKITFKGLYGSMRDDEWNRKTMYNWAIGAGQTVRLQNIHSIMRNRLFGGELAGNFKLADGLNLSWKAAHYDNQFRYGPIPLGNDKDDFRNGYHVVQFERFNLDYLDQVFVDEFGNPVDDPRGALELKLIGNDHPTGGDVWDNIQPIIAQELVPEEFEFSGAYSELNSTQERDPIVGQLDLEYKPFSRLSLKTGGKFRMKEGSRELGLHEWIQDVSVSSNPLYLPRYDVEALDLDGGFLQEHGEPYEGTFMPFLTLDALDDFVEQLGDTVFERKLDSNHPDFDEWVGSRYSYTEQVGAVYVMGEYQINPKLDFIGGLRMEHTSLNMEADTVLEGYFDLDSLKFIYPVEDAISESRYLSVLPMAHLKYSPVEQANLRFSITRTFRRPNFNETKPGSPVKDFTNLEFTFGNRNLRPSYSWNFDLMGEYFFSNVGMVSAGVFYKDIRDHIFATITADADPLTGIIYKSYQNADDSWLMGFECSVNRRFDFLPGFLSGFGVNGNYTFIQSEMKVPGREAGQPLPRQAKHLYNLALFYENDSIGFQCRLALNYKGPYLMELNLAAIEGANGETELLHTDTDFDIFMGAFTSLDMLATWRFNQHLTLFLEMNNLLNAPLRIYRGNPDRPVQTEYYSFRGQAGVRFAL